MIRITFKGKDIFVNIDNIKAVLSDTYVDDENQTETDGCLVSFYDAIPDPWIEKGTAIFDGINSIFVDSTAEEVCNNIRIARKTRKM